MFEEQEVTGVRALARQYFSTEEFQYFSTGELQYFSTEELQYFSA